VYHESESTALWSIGTAVPSFHVSQQDALGFVLSHVPSDMARRLKFLYRRSQIDSRYSCSPNLYDAMQFSAAEGASSAPSTAERALTQR